MTQLFNTFLNQPLQFQILAALAAGLFILSWILLFFKRGITMIFATLLSTTACYFCIHSSLVIPVYIGVMWIQLKFFTKALVKEQLQKEQQLYSSEYETETVNPEDFTWLDLDWYDAMQQELEAFGFYKVRDLENLPQTRAFPEIRTFTRSFNHEEQDIGADVNQIRVVKPKNIFERNVDAKIISFCAEFSDGTFLETSNTLGVNPIHEIEGVVLKQFPQGTPLEELLDAHEDEIENICEKRNVEVVLHRTEEELTAAGKREFLLFQKDRQKKGGLTDEEIARNAAILAAAPGGTNDGTFYEEYKRQTRKFLRRERRKS